MAEFFDFALRHWYLFLMLFIIIGMLVGGEIFRKIRGITALNPNQVLQKINQDDALLIDVRSENEFNSGHLPQARHIPTSSIEQRLKEIQKFKEKPVVVYCQTGQRSASAGAKLKKAGFETVHTLHGGLAAWQSANLPISKSKK